MNTAEHMPEVTANAATGAAVGGTVITWVADLTMWMQLGITGGTLVAVWLSIWWNILKIKSKRREMRERTNLPDDMH